MPDAWSFSTELPMLITDENRRLCYCNAVLERSIQGVWQEYLGTPVEDLALRFIPDNIVTIMEQLADQTQHEGVVAPAPSSGDGALVFAFTTINRSRYFAIIQLLELPAMQAPEPVTSVFQFMREGRRRKDQNGDSLSSQDRHLIQSEKMAAIGQLAAGVAHEINNPIGYICSNLNSLSDYVNTLIQLTDSIEHVQTVEEIRQLRSQLDYAYIKSDIQDCIGESAEGANRVRDIIAALKDFSHSDDGAFSPFGLVEAFETTLKLANNEVKYKCNVHREFQDVPRVECSSSQIKQVVMNLVVNAAHAIEDQGNIWLRLGQEGEQVWFEVEDDGRGIEEDKQSRIFEPFYTTKPVGEGTGLGLSLSYSIIQRHRGRIELHSQAGVGSRFRIWLPIAQAVA